MAPYEIVVLTPFDAFCLLLSIFVRMYGTSILSYIVTVCIIKSLSHHHQNSFKSNQHSAYLLHLHQHQYQNNCR